MFLRRYHLAAQWDAAMPSAITTPREVAPRSTSSTTSTAQDTSEITSSLRIWMIIAVVTAFLTLSACVVLVALTISKRSIIKQQLEEGRSRDLYLEEKDVGRKRMMTAEEFALESTREHIIRKSLASRSSRSASLASSTTQVTFDQASAVEKFDFRCEGLKSDWKNTEARVLRQKSMSSLPTSKSPFPDLPAPTLSRSSSPSRNPHLPSRTELPPLLEQHPCLR